ncbi:hypothetical protein RRG08_065822 [Elysia crispata]|uniref:Uncharacterized protein n=1 Tax=Elysia crispata TaxID=231223 RepID=A0AAE0Y5C2_9GAST|nr:hypothetical protein RRG08_065822 [Elysia crispata]
MSSESEISELLESGSEISELLESGITRWTDGEERGSESEISELLESPGGRMEKREAQSQRYRSCYNQQVDGWSRDELRVRDIGVVRISRLTDAVERSSESEISELLESESEISELLESAG